jgi:hypothetical protein
VQIQAHFRLKPHLREIFRHLDVTRRYTLTLFRDGQYIRVGFSLRVYRVPRSKKSEKRKNRAQKMTKIDKSGQNRPKMEKKDPLK